MCLSIERAAGAVSSCRRHQLSLWDALIVQAAVKTGCTTVLTEDLQDGLEIGTLRIANPFLKTNSRLPS